MSDMQKSILKKIIPLTLRNNIRSLKSKLWIIEQLTIGMLFKDNELSNYTGDMVFLIGVPEHGNLGDQAIGFVEKSFLSERIKTKAVYYITEYGFYRRYFSLKNYIK